MHLGQIERQIVFRCGPAKGGAPADRHKSDCRRKINESMKINMSKTDFGGLVTPRNMQQQQFILRHKQTRLFLVDWEPKWGGAVLGLLLMTFEIIAVISENNHNTHKAQTCFRSAQQDQIVSSDGC